MEIHIILIKNAALSSLFLIFSSSFIYSMENNDLFNPAPMIQAPSLVEQINEQLCDQICKSYEKKLFKPKINSLMASSLASLSEDAKGQLVSPIYAKLTYNYANRKPFFNYHKENLICQIGEEAILPKKIARLFSDNLKAQESYLDTIKFWLDPTDLKKGFINSTAGNKFNLFTVPCVFLLSMASPCMHIITSKHISSWQTTLNKLKALNLNNDKLIKEITAIEKQLRSLHNKLAIADTSEITPFLVFFLIALYTNFDSFKNNNDTNEYQPRQMKRLYWQYPTGSFLGGITILGLLYKLANFTGALLKARHTTIIKNMQH